MDPVKLSVTALEDRLTPVSLPDGFAFSFVAGGLTAPTSFVESPDGRIFVTEQHGSVRVVTANGSLLPTPALQLTVDSFIERGLLGIALDPDFENTGYVFVYYTVPESPTEPVHNRISRFSMVGNVLEPASELVLLNLDPLGAGAHNGGALRFGTDGKLYVAVGDNVVPANAQLSTNYFGKVLRLNPDGTIPADNPSTIDGIATPTQGVYRAIYAAGFRNPFTFDIDSVSGSIFVNDVGQDSVEEVNDLGAGRNYGWPATEGTFNLSAFPAFTLPIISYNHTPGTLDGGYAVTGGAFYRPVTQTFPAEYTGDYFFNDFVNGWIRRYDVATGSNTLFASELNGLFVLGLESSRNGSLLVLAYGSGEASTGAVYRIQYTDEPNIITHPRDIARFPGQSATFSVEASSALPLTYQWQRDGQNIPNATGTSYALNVVGPADDGAVFQVIVSNATESITSDPAILSISTNLPPLPVIVTPEAGTTFAYGQTFSFSGVAVDYEDGELPASSLSWRIDYITGNAAPRPFYPETSGIAKGTVTLPTSSPYTRTDVRYRFVLTATDSFGNKASVSRDLLPQLGTATLQSDTPGATVVLDGNAMAAPVTIEGVLGLERTLSAGFSVVVDGQIYPFQGWSDGVTTNSRTFRVASGGTTYQANYLPVFATSPPPPAGTSPPTPTILVGSGAGPSARILDAQTGNGIATLDLSGLALPDGAQFTEARVARGDLNGDGIAEIVVGNGPGSAPYVAIYDGATQDLITTFLAFEATFTGGVFVAVGDLDGDGLADVIVTPDRGGGPRVRAFRNGNPGEILADFFGIDDPNFRGGARATLGDLNGDGRADLIVAAGFDGGPRLAAYDGRLTPGSAPVKLFNDFFAFEESLRNGVFVAVGDFDGDGMGDIVAAGGPGGGPRVTIFSGAVLLQSNQKSILSNFFAGDPNARNGVRLAVMDQDSNNAPELLVGTAAGVQSQVFVYRATDLTAQASPQPDRVITAFDDGFTGGIFVG